MCKKELTNKFQELNLKGENQKWLELLTNNKCDEDLFRNSKEGFYNKRSPMFGVLEFRKTLLQLGRGQDLTAKELDKVLESGDKNKLKEVLSELFLEPISIEEIEIYLKKVKNGLTSSILLYLHKKHLIMDRFACIIVAWKTLLKQDEREKDKKKEISQTYDCAIGNSVVENVHIEFANEEMREMFNKSIGITV